MAAMYRKHTFLQHIIRERLQAMSLDTVTYATVNTYTTPDYTSDGYSVSKSGMNVGVHLKNTKNRETIWMTEGFSGGNAYVSFSDLTVSVAKTTVEELRKEGFITVKEVPQKDITVSEE